MNAIIGLCHFCEAHGPCPLFCTYTTDDENHTKVTSSSAVECTGCTSLGPETILISRDDDGTIFCSAETVPNPNVTAFLRQAAIRSITCEVSWSKDGGVVYFSESQGHVLSLNFQIKDTRARGLQRWFSIVVLMKDKMLLLNITPMLSMHMQKIAKELQLSAEVIFNNEQKVFTQRALRLRTGRNDFGQSRSLAQLTGDQDVFKKLHSHFTWMLKAGALTYSETLNTSHNMLQKLSPHDIKNSIFEPDACNVPDDENCIALRALENLLSIGVFRILMYCTLTGIYIVLNTNIPDSEVIEKTLKMRLTPDYNNSNIKINKNNIELSSDGTCVLEYSDNKYNCKWCGVIPKKVPTIMSKIENAMNNSNFNDAVLHQHVKSIILEWQGTTKAVKSAIESSGPNSEAVQNLKKIFSLTPQDEVVVQYWMSLL